MKDSSFRSCSIQMIFYFVPATIVAPKAHHPPNDTTHSNHSFGIELCPPIWHHQHLGLSCMCPLHKLLPQERYKITRKKLSLFICWNECTLTYKAESEEDMITRTHALSMSLSSSPNGLSTFIYFVVVVAFMFQLWDVLLRTVRRQGIKRRGISTHFQSPQFLTRQT